MPKRDSLESKHAPPASELESICTAQVAQLKQYGDQIRRPYAMLLSVVIFPILLTWLLVNPRSPFHFIFRDYFLGQLAEMENKLIPLLREYQNWQKSVALFFQKLVSDSGQTCASQQTCDAVIVSYLSQAEKVPSLCIDMHRRFSHLLKLAYGDFRNWPDLRSVRDFSALRLQDILRLPQIGGREGDVPLFDLYQLLVLAIDNIMPAYYKSMLQIAPGASYETTTLHFKERSFWPQVLLGWLGYQFILLLLNRLFYKRWHNKPLTSMSTKALRVLSGQLQLELDNIASMRWWHVVMSRALLIPLMLFYLNFQNEELSPQLMLMMIASVGTIFSDFSRETLLFCRETASNYFENRFCRYLQERLNIYVRKVDKVIYGDETVVCLRVRSVDGFPIKYMRRWLAMQLTQNGFSVHHLGKGEIYLCLGRQRPSIQENMFAKSFSRARNLYRIQKQLASLSCYLVFPIFVYNFERSECYVRFKPLGSVRRCFVRTFSLLDEDSSGELEMVCQMPLSDADFQRLKESIDSSRFHLSVSDLVLSRSSSESAGTRRSGVRPRSCPEMSAISPSVQARIDSDAIAAAFFSGAKRLECQWGGLHFATLNVKQDDFNGDARVFDSVVALFSKGKIVPPKGCQGIVPITHRWMDYGVSWFKLKPKSSEWRVFSVARKPKSLPDGRQAICHDFCIAKRARH